MKQRSSKLQSEKIMGKYLNHPYKKVKKREKIDIKRNRRMLEKREVINEVNEQDD